MRDLFDEVAGKSPLDPQEAVRREARVPKRKRFYKEAGVAEAESGFAITLDGKPIKTPSGRTVTVPVRAIADAIAAEWRAQEETIDPLTMPLTRFANSVVESVVDRVTPVRDEVARYLHSDLLFYRAGHPQALVEKEAQHWDPVLFWAADRLGAAGAGAGPWRVRSRCGLGRRPCRRGLELRSMGRGRGGCCPPRRPGGRFPRRGADFARGEASRLTTSLRAPR
jgi:hypothetical protein